MAAPVSVELLGQGTKIDVARFKAPTELLLGVNQFCASNMGFLNFADNSLRAKLESSPTGKMRHCNPD